MPKPRTLVDLYCANDSCKALFRPRYATSTFCTPECWHAANSRSRKECEACKTPFKGNYAEQRYCSVACKNAGLSRDKTTICQHCAVEFQRPHGKKRAYCSVDCASKAKAGGRKAHLEPLKPKAKPTWKTTHGYQAIKVDGKTKLQHRLVVEEKIGRKLLPQERVHHINGIRDDNRPENLELWLVKGNSKKDPAGQRMQDLKTEFLSSFGDEERAIIEARFHEVFKV